MKSAGDDDDDVPSLLSCNQMIIAEILSYVITSTKEFARFRRVCKIWKTFLLPYCLQHNLIPFLKVCYPPKHPEFLPELVKLGSERFGGKLYEDLDVLTDMLERNEFDFFVLGSIYLSNLCC
jgi:hypothetical protein